ncbi:MAG: rSAM/selenodomain-associated transferase 2 [Alphaproteobacteria bacterium]
MAGNPCYERNQMPHPPSISVVIPTLNAAAHLSAALESVRGTAEIIVADGGSTDDTCDMASSEGARVVLSEKGRGQQLGTGAATATSDWLLFLHADTVLPEGWQEDVLAHAADPANDNRAAVFTFALDDASPKARRMERLVAWRTRRLGLPYGDQGLLISRIHYDRLGGFRPMPLMEDVDIVRRIGRANLDVLDTRAVTSAERYRRGGWWGRPVRNIICLSLYFLAVPPRILVRLYR